MNAEELLKRVIEYGADRDGIDDRFCGNAELYEDCFREFLDEPNNDALRLAIDGKDYAQAFEAAHALKGLSGNLGVTAYYEAICELVETLRAKRYAAVMEDFERVQRERENLRRIAAGEEPVPDVKIEAAEEEGKKRKKKIDRFLLTLIGTLTLFVVGVSIIFTSLLTNYRKNVTRESAEHLVEIGEQITLYIEEKISYDWKTVSSVADSMRYSRLTDDDQAIFELMLRQRDRWKVTDIQLFTANGYAISADGEVDTNDAASDIAVRAIERGKYLAIVDSKLIYTIPVETQITYRGSRIVALSLVQKMESFLDDMNFSSFDGYARMYLTEESGIVLSSLSATAAVTAFNYKAVIRQRSITYLDPSAKDDELFTAQEPIVFIMTDDTHNDYAVSIPVATASEPLRLIYAAPVSIVNKTLNGFSRQLSTLSITVIALVAFFAFAGFFLTYRNRKIQFAKALMARERMFDLLVRNTRTVFGLFTVNQNAPDFISANCAQTVGFDSFTLHRDGKGFRLRGGEGRDEEAIMTINEMISLWDGRGEFASGYIRKDGSGAPRYFDLHLYPADDGREAYVGVMQDTTSAFEREEATRSALRMAERANEAKSRFLSNMSHDIRTPMNAIVNMTAFALDSLNEPRKLGQYLQTIRESSDHLLRLINDVLDMSRIESGQITVDAQPFDLREELHRLAEMIIPLSEAKSQTFITDFSRMYLNGVKGDRLKFSQIVMNLLSNAVKFTPERGAVRFSAEELPSLRDDIVNVRFVIEDNGIGISTENQKHIFEPFSRADDHQVSRIEGTGLGLSICRSYVSAMGGTLRCESEEGEGSVFILELYFEKAEFVPREEQTHSLTALPFLGMHCLLAEDNPTNQMIARTMLERLGFMIDEASDGGEAVRMFVSSLPGTYDVVYMDIQMPVMDGYRASIAIRESGHPQAESIPILAMTANVFAEDIEKARVAGMDGHLGKPLIQAKLIEVTNAAMKKRKEESA